MKKVLDLTKCNSTEEICDVLEKELDNKRKADAYLKEAGESLVEEYKKEEVAEPKKKVTKEELASAVDSAIEAELTTKE